MTTSVNSRMKYAGWLLGMSLGVASLPPAMAVKESAAFASAGDAGTVKIELSHSAIRLEVSAARLGRVLDELSARLTTPIHYAQAPEQPVTVTCRGENLEKVLWCLLGADADLVFQYAGAKRQGGTRRVASVKVLASTFSDLPAWGQDHPESSRVPMRERDNADQGHDSLAAVLTMTRSHDPEQRAMALEKIRRVEGVDDATLQATYQSALNDADGDVRAEAISGLALLNAEGSFPMLSSALSDEHPSVRLAALDGMEVTSESRPYYEKALTDPDEAVRDLAALRLGLE